MPSTYNGAPVHKRRILAHILLWGGAIWTFLLWSHAGQAVPVVVEGNTSLTLQANKGEGGLEVRGRLRDDVGTPAIDKPIALALEPGGNMRSLRPCPLSQGALLRKPDGRVQVRTNDEGRFCVFVHSPSANQTLVASFTGEGGYAASTARVPLEAGRAAASLVWLNRQNIVDLDKASSEVLVGAPGLRPKAVVGAHINLLLDGKEVAESLLDGRGQTSFRLDRKLWKTPGAHKLTLVAPKRPGLQPVEANVVATALVALVVAPPAGPLIPHDGIEFAVAVDSAMGPVDGGNIEISLGNQPLAIAPVSKGAAKPRLKFDVLRAQKASLSFAYVPSGNGYIPGGAKYIPVELKPPSPLRKAPLALVALGVLVWLLRSWRRPAAKERPKTKGKPALAEVVLPPYEHVPAKAAGTLFRLSVRDAHTKEPLEGVQIRLLKRDFNGEAQLGSWRTDGEGICEFEHAWEGGLHLTLTARLYADLDRPLPPPGEIRFALTTRRRALLARLVQWVQNAGSPWKKLGPNPTPGQVRRLASGLGQSPAEEWASEVEAAAYGPHEVDELREHQVDNLKPDKPKGKFLGHRARPSASINT